MVERTAHSSSASEDWSSGCCQVQLLSQRHQSGYDYPVWEGEETIAKTSLTVLFEALIVNVRRVVSMGFLSGA